MAASERADPPAAGRPRPTLRARDAVAITVGIVIGAGIFRTPSLVAGATGSEAVLLAAWLAGGILSIVGALCYAELASAYPDPGGDYHYLFRAFGPRLAFLYAWARLAVIQTGSVALLAFVAGDYLAEMIDIGAGSSAFYAGLAVAALTIINCAGVRQGVATQNWLTMIEVSGLALVIVAGFLLAPSAAEAPAAERRTDFGLIMVLVLLTYGGWNEAAYVSAELRRRIAPVLVGSLMLVTALYLLVNLAYLRALGLPEMAGSEAVAADLMGGVAGVPGAAMISALVLVSALTSANATMITGARSVYALARDYRTVPALGRWNERTGTPTAAVILQGGAALLLVGLGSMTRDGFRAAVDYTAPVFWFFFMLVGAALFVLRVRDPDAPRPFRVPLYPLLPAIFCLTSAYLLYASIAYAGAGAVLGISVLAAGALLRLILAPRFEGAGGNE